MSRKSAAPNDVKSAKSYVEWLANLGVADVILIGGSRSPLREKQPHKDSDWDFVLVTKIQNFKIVSPRTGNRLHGDLLVITPDKLQYMHKLAEIWPNDEYGVLDVK